MTQASGGTGGGRMKLTRQRRITREQPQLEMTPMIDVVFQLLIFF
jgi:biopolymer transport protein ExbD